MTDGTLPDPVDPPEPLPEELMALQFSRRPLDTIALPLLAPIAEFLVECGNHPAWEGDLGRLTACNSAVRAARSSSGVETGAHAAAILLTGTVVAEQAHTLMNEIDLQEELFGDLEDDGKLTRAAFKAWLERTDPHPAHAALVAASLGACADHALFPRPGKRSQALHRTLFHYVRLRGAATWPDAFAMARVYWMMARHREHLLLGAWNSALASWWQTESRQEWNREEYARKIEELRQQIREGEIPVVAYRSEDLDLAAELEDAKEHIRAVAPLVSRLQQQLKEAQAAARTAKAQRDDVHSVLKPLQRELDRQTHQARAITLLHAELRASLEAGQVEDIALPPEEGWPADLLSGCTIQLFTGQERAGARAQMADALRAVGATVSASDGNGREGVPDSFPDGTIVVCDVRFMAHTWSGRLADRAKRSGVTYIEVRAGQGGIVRAVAAALGRGGAVS
jgi:hypothetical protein